MSDTDLTPEQWLAHFGVKGMKWGVRKKYNERQTKALNRERRVADGTATKRDKLRILSTSSAAELVANKGLKNTAKKHADAREAHLDRINKGQAKTSDLVRMYGSMSAVDLLNAGRNKNRSFRPA